MTDRRPNPPAPSVGTRWWKECRRWLAAPHHSAAQRQLFLQRRLGMLVVLALLIVVCGLYLPTAATPFVVAALLAVLACGVVLLAVPALQGGHRSEERTVRGSLEAAEKPGRPRTAGAGRPAGKPERPALLPGQSGLPDSGAEQTEEREAAPEGSGGPAEQNGQAIPAPPFFRQRSSLSGEPWRLPARPAHSGLVADQATIGDLEVRGASVVGPGHRVGGTVGKPRQDAYRLGCDSVGEHVIAALADGMSDSEHSDAGAGVAVAALVGAFRKELDQRGAVDFLGAEEAFLAAARQMYNAAQQRGWNPENDVRSVALTAVVPTRAGADGFRRVLLSGIGDTSAWKLCGDRWTLLLGGKEHGYDEGRVHHFLPNTPRQVRTTEVWLRDGEVLVLATDGLGDILRVPSAAHWFAEQWAAPVSALGLLWQVGYEEAQYNDDRTAVVLWTPRTGETR